ncbi:hypothetical protein [Arthrobacter sp. NPDC057013]|uniref:hypothetical protein n=1 Tax=Arthrobacter sp. NPDC057013 TaxID=3345999 RepID=UPI0036431914
MKGEKVEDWADLPGQHIAIRKLGRLVRLGEVEDVTATGDMLWLRQEGIELRTLFHKAEGFSAWLNPTEAAPGTAGK